MLSVEDQVESELFASRSCKMENWYSGFVMHRSVRIFLYIDFDFEILCAESYKGKNWASVRDCALFRKKHRSKERALFRTLCLIDSLVLFSTLPSLGFLHVMDFIPPDDDSGDSLEGVLGGD